MLRDCSRDMAQLLLCSCPSWTGHTGQPAALRALLTCRLPSIPGWLSSSHMSGMES